MGPVITLGRALILDSAARYSEENNEIRFRIVELKKASMVIIFACSTPSAGAVRHAALAAAAVYFPDR